MGSAETLGAGLTVTELLSRQDVVEFVEHHANALITPGVFTKLQLPEGLTPETAFDLVEFVRRTGAGMPVCGRRRNCGHEGSWYAMTPAFSSRLAHLEYRTRPKGSLQQQFETYRATKGFYPPRLAELENALALDGAPVPYEVLRELRLGDRQPASSREHLAANALALLAELESGAQADAPLGENVLNDLFDRLEQQVEGLDCRPVKRPPTACYSICDRFSVPFIVSAFQEGAPSDVHPIMVLLFCSEAMWKTAVFPRWNNVMEVVVRSLLFSHMGMPLLSYVPLAMEFWRWQIGLDGLGDGPRYGEEMFSARYGVDMTPLFSKLVGILEDGLDALAAWVGEQRANMERRREAIVANRTLNHRQQRLLLDLLEHPTLTLDAAEYGHRYGIVASTAYADLQKLVSRGFLVTDSQNKVRTFKGAPGLATMLDRAEPL